MYKRSGCYVTSILFFTLMTPVFALSSDEARLLQKDYQLYKLWSISRDYLFGMTHKTDRVRALAWQFAYVDHLPIRYPQKNAILATYQRGLSMEQIAQAEVMASNISQKYALGAAMSEGEMSAVYPLRDETNTWSKALSPRNKNTGVTGRVLPWSDLDHSEILLRQERVDRDESDPWDNPFIPLTVTNTGEFYITGLAAGRYELFISSLGLNTKVRFGVKAGEIRGLSLINLKRQV